MSWVRYDDGFDSHPKVTAAIAQDPGCIGLHVLANTWSGRQKRPGFVPEHQPGILVGKARGRKWAAILERVGLWDRVEGGWEFHDHAVYRTKTRQAAGTPADLSSKRAAAGSKGGKTAQQRKQEAKQTVEQTEQTGEQPNEQAQATGEQQAANALSPVVASNEATPVVAPNGATPVRASPAVAAQSAPQATPDSAQVLIAEWIDACRKRPPDRTVGKLSKELRALLAEGIDPNDVRQGLIAWHQRGLDPSVLASVVNEVMNASPSARASPARPSRIEVLADVARELEGRTA